MNGRIVSLVPYWVLLFVIGFGWFVIAPLVPSVISAFHASLSGAILLISIYGYAVVIVGLIAGFISAKFSVRLSLYISAILTTLGFLGRIFSTNYQELLVFQTISAIGYPMAIAPVGGVVESVMQGRSHTLIGISVGILFGGMSAGSLIGPYFFTKYRERVDVGMTLTTMNIEEARQIEPLAPLPLARIETLKRLKESGVQVWMFLGPVIPGLNFLGVLEEAGKIGVRVIYDVLNYYQGLPFRSVPRNKWKELEEQIRKMCEELGVQCHSEQEDWIYETKRRYNTLF